MKKLIYPTLTAILLFSTLAFRNLQQYTDIFKQLQIEPAEAKESIFTNFQDGVLDFPYSTVVTKFALNGREAAVKELGDFIKAYSESAEFAQKYKQVREAAQPQEVEGANDKITARLQQLEQDMTSNANSLKGATGDKQTLLLLTQKELTKELLALTHPEDPKHDFYIRKLTKTKAWEMAQASEDQKSWLQDYPPTVTEIVRKRLTQFLALTKDIDFNAKLVRSGSKMVFADPMLEAKSGEWKRCFRCGKETITAARNYAQQWLTSLK